MNEDVLMDYPIISSPTFKLNFFLKRKTIPYKIGVSKAATITLKTKPLISKPLNMFQGKILKQNNKKSTVKVSMN